MNQAMQQMATSGPGKCDDSEAIKLALRTIVLSMSCKMQAAQSSQTSASSDFANARIAALKNATTGNQGAEALQQMDPQMLQSLIE